MDSLQIKDMKLTWIESTTTLGDGGTLFGPVPKAVWSKKYPNNSNNQITTVEDPILIQLNGKNYLIDAGFETSKFNPKTWRNTGVQNETTFTKSLAKLGLTPLDIDAVLMTHMHNDHASGLTRVTDSGKLESVFPNALIYMTETEWAEVRSPNARTRGTYLKENWEPIQEQVRTFDESIEIVPGIEMIQTGGHSKGLAIIKLQQEEEVLLHLSDLMITTATLNPLWVSSYDDYPMDSIAAKEFWLKEAVEKGYKLIFYHDAYYCMLQFSKDGKEVIDSLERSKDKAIDWPEDILKWT